MDVERVDGRGDVADAAEVGDTGDSSMMPDTRRPSVDAEACGQHAARTNSY